MNTCISNQGLGELGDEDDEDAASTIECEGDADEGDDPPRPPDGLLGDGGVGVAHLPLELHVPLLQHDPAQPQPRAGEPRVYGEQEDQDHSQDTCMPGYDEDKSNG